MQAYILCRRCRSCHKAIMVITLSAHCNPLESNSLYSFIKKKSIDLRMKWLLWHSRAVCSMKLNSLIIELMYFHFPRTSMKGREISAQWRLVRVSFHLTSYYVILFIQLPRPCGITPDKPSEMWEKWNLREQE